MTQNDIDEVIVEVVENYTRTLDDGMEILFPEDAIRAIQGAIAEIQRTQEPFAFWSKGTIPLFTFPPAPVVPEGWQPIDTAPSLTAVLIAYRNALGESRVIKARFIPKGAVEQTDGECEGFYDYDESRDFYSLPEGWYEQIDNCDEYSEVFIHEKPTCWMPLPAAPEYKEGE